MNVKTVADFYKALVHGPYAWPGGYPCYFITADGAALSYATAFAEAKQIIEAIQDTQWGGQSGWRVVACDINWEDGDLHDDHTNEPIESAYGESA